MSEGFAGQSYLDQLRPDRGWSVRVALLTAYSADLIAVGAALLAMTGRNSESGSGNAADFAESVERMRGCLRVIVSTRPAASARDTAEDRRLAGSIRCRERL